MSFHNRYFLVILLIILKFNHSHLWNRDDRAECKENGIVKNVENADLILAGTIKDHAIYLPDSAIIKINRLIKGHNQLLEILNDNNQNQYDRTRRIRKKVKSIRQSTFRKILNNSSYILVKNFDQNFCVSRLKQEDSAVFLIKIDYSTKEFYLNSSIVRIRKTLDETNKRDGK